MKSTGLFHEDLASPYSCGVFQLFPTFCNSQHSTSSGVEWKKKKPHSAFLNIPANKNGILDYLELMIKGMAYLTGRI